MEDRWQGRSALAALVRAAVFALPLAASVVAGAVLSRMLPRPDGWVDTIAWWVVLLGSVTFVMLGVDRLARRLLPLAALLRLSLIFPDRAPSRFRVAVRAGGTRKLQERLREFSEEGLPEAPAEAAGKVLELAGLLNLHDRRTRGHSERVRVYADLLADELKLSPHDRNRLHWAALLHDIGKLVVPGHILNKPTEPDEAEWEILRRHPIEGERFIEPLREWLGAWAMAIGQHHERYDGTGYPRGLGGHDISMAARIVAVADAYEVMTAARAYKKPMAAAEARRELARCAGSQFDPLVVRAFLNVSLGRLRWAVGPLSWLVQLPVVAQLPTIGSAATSGIGAAAAGVAASTAVVLGVAEIPPVHLPPPVAVTVTTDVEAPTAPTATTAARRGASTTVVPDTSTSASAAPTTAPAATDDTTRERPTATTGAPTTQAPSAPAEPTPTVTQPSDPIPSPDPAPSGPTTSTTRPTTTTSTPPTEPPAPPPASEPTTPTPRVESADDRDRGSGNDGNTPPPTGPGGGSGKSG